MNNKDKIIPILVFIITFAIITSLFYIINNSKKNKYSCYDYENNINYKFSTEEEMHEVCDNLNSGEKENQIMDKYNIYNDLKEVNDPDFAFYPYVNSDDELTIIITILECNNKTLAKQKAENWFINHSYNINDYTIEYEYACESDY